MKIHEYNEMMAYLTRPARTVYNSGGRVGFSQGSNLLNKLTDAQIRKLFPTYFDAAATATKVDEDIIRKILKMYSAKEGGRTYIGKQLKLDQSVIGRILNKAFEKNILKPVNPAEFKTNLALKKYGDISERNIYKIVRPVEPRDYIKDPTIPKSARFKVQVPSGEKGTTTKMVYTTTKSAGENAIKKAEKLTETIKIAKKKPFEDAVKAIHRIAMANPEDLNNIKNLSKMVYGADDVKNLTRTANDLVRYQEFLLGFRPIAGISIPVEEKLTDIISEFPSSGQWGKFAAGAIRESKLKMRDQLLKTKGPKLITLRNNILKFVDSGAMQLDEAMGVSATFETAPGYTELGQIIKKSINQAKSKEIDNPFSKLFAKVVAGETNPTITHKGEKIGVKEFNEISKKFQKINKVDTPIIEYTPGKKIDASKFIKHFDKLTPEAQKNVTALADQGIALRSTAMPMVELFQMAKADAAANGPICRIVGARQSGGSAVSCVDAVDEALEKNPKKLAQDINKSNMGGAFNKVKNSSTKFLTAIKANPNILKGRFGVLAALGVGTVAAGVGAGALVKQFRNDDPSTYLTNDNQMEGMIISDVEQKGEEVDDNILLDNQFKLEAAAAAGLTTPIAGQVYRTARQGTPPLLESPLEFDNEIKTLKRTIRQITHPGGKKAKRISEAGQEVIRNSKIRISQLQNAVETAKVGKEGSGVFRSALGLEKGVLGKGLWALGAPIIQVPSTIGYIAKDVREGKDVGEIATNPLNYLGAAFMNPSVKALARAGASRGLLGIASLGLAGTALGAVALPAISIGAGLATLGTLGYQGYKLFSGNKSSSEDFFK